MLFIVVSETQLLTPHDPIPEDLYELFDFAIQLQRICNVCTKFKYKIYKFIIKFIIIII